MDYNSDSSSKQEKLSKNDNLALEICIDIASVIILVIGCGGGLLIAADSVIFALASIVLSLSIALILLAIKKLTIIEIAIYEELKYINEDSNKNEEIRCIDDNIQSKEADDCSDKLDNK